MTDTDDYDNEPEAPRPDVWPPAGSLLETMRDDPERFMGGLMRANRLYNGPCCVCGRPWKPVHDHATGNLLFAYCPDCPLTFDLPSGRMNQ